jgi:drug/metabolite transporter (DMT)-like permease
LAQRKKENSMRNSRTCRSSAVLGAGVALAAFGTVVSPITGGLAHAAPDDPCFVNLAKLECFYIVSELRDGNGTLLELTLPRAHGSEWSAIGIGLTTISAANPGPPEWSFKLNADGSFLIGNKDTGAAVAVLSSVLPYTFEMLALRRLAPAVFAILMSLAPAIAALAGYLILDQVLNGTDLIAIAMVVLASAGAVRTVGR